MQGKEQQGNVWGKKMDPQLLDKMNDQQLGQLYELRQESKRPVNEQTLLPLGTTENNILDIFIRQLNNKYQSHLPKQSTLKIQDFV